MRRSQRPFIWTAETCNYSNADIYIGLAPGLEDAALRQSLDAGALGQYPTLQVPIATNGHHGGEVTLRMYAIRDPSVCTIERCADQPSAPGFHRVRLLFDLTTSSSASPTPSHSNDDELPVPPVIAFLLTIGLSAQAEREFFNGVVARFLDESWSSLPRLLREIGCTSIADAA